MNKEELYKYYKRKTKEEIIEELLYKCNANYYLISKINKAKEYIEELDDNENSYGDYEIHYQVKKELLDILKGSDTK